MKNKTIVIIATLILVSVLAGYAAWQIRLAHYPLPLEASEEWEPYIESLDVQREYLFVDSDGILLEAELFIPNGGREQKPAIIFAPGSSDNIYQNYSGGFVETHILDTFLSRDMAVLLINKRGMGQSEGNFWKNSIEGRAEDIYAAVQTIQVHPQIDAAGVGLIGHSQGGWVVTHAAGEHPDVAFFINLAGPTMMIIEQSADRSAVAARCNGLSDEEVDQFVERRLREMHMGMRLGELTDFGIFGFDARTNYYDPEASLLKVSSPGLYIFGGNDSLVTPSLNIDHMNDMFNDNVPDRLAMVTIDGASHAFRLVDSVCDGSGIADDHPYAEQLAIVVNDWLDAQGF